MALNAKQIERAKTRRKYSDGRGLFLSVSANGRKSWAFCYRLPNPAKDVFEDGKLKRRGYTEREMGLGSIDWLPLRDARHKADELRMLVRQGIDPLNQRVRETRAVARQKRDGSTFKAVAERFIGMKKEEWDAGGKSEGSWNGSLTRHVYPMLGDKLITEIDRLDVRDVLLPIWTKVTTTATRLLPRIEEIFDYAIGEGLMAGENPANRLKVRKLLPKASRVYSPKKHKALPYPELPNFMATLRKRDGVAPRALEFLILTAARTQEAIGATWDEIDLEAKVWTIPASRMKVKKFASGEERAPHRVPLSDAAIAVLSSAIREKGNPHVFISRSNEGAGLSNMAMLELLKNDMGYAGQATVHGFRAAFRTWAAEATSYAEDLAEKALAHEEEDKVVSAYKRTDLLDKRRPMMVDWAEYLAPKKEADDAA
jgi:integrase